jgi:hypothetical protein
MFWPMARRRVTSRAKRHAPKTPPSSPRRAFFEPLEDRRVLSGDGGLVVITDPIYSPPDFVASSAPYPWRNSVNYLDVRGTGGVSPIDALLVINDMLVNGIHELPPRSVDDFISPYLDVFPDNLVSPADVVQVINALLAFSAVEASGVPNTRLVLEGSFDPGADTTVQFTDALAHVAEMPALAVTATSVETAIPPYFDVENLQFRPGIVSVTVVQDVAGGTHTIYETFRIEEIPLPADQVGELTHELVRSLQGLTSLNLNEYRRIAATIGLEDEPDFVAFDTLVESELRQLLTVRQAVDSLMTDSVEAVELFVDVTDPNETQFSLTRDWLSATDRQIAGWLAAATGQTDEVTVDDLRAYLNAFMADVAAGRANDDAAALARARETYDEILAFATGTIWSAVSLESAVAGDAQLAVEPAASAETTLAVGAAGLVTMANLAAVAGEFYGTSVDDYRETIDYLVSSRVRDVLRIGGTPLASLVPSPSDGAGLDFLQYAGVLGDVLGALHNPGFPGHLGELGLVFDANFDTIVAELPPITPAVRVVRVDPSVPLETTPAGGSATFHVQLTGPPAATVFVFFTSSDPTEGMATPAVTIDPLEWMLLFEVTVTGVDDGTPEGTVPYVVHVFTDSDDLDFDDLDLDDVPITQVDP